MAGTGSGVFVICATGIKPPLQKGGLAVQQFLNAVCRGVGSASPLACSGVGFGWAHESSVATKKESKFNNLWDNSSKDKLLLVTPKWPTKKVEQPPKTEVTADNIAKGWENRGFTGDFLLRASKTKTVVSSCPGRQGLSLVD